MVVHGPGPWGGPWTRSMGWSMDPGPCFVYVLSGGICSFDVGRNSEVKKCRQKDLKMLRALLSNSYYY